MALALHVRLANGVELEMGKAIATIDELTTLVQIRDAARRGGG